MTTERGSCHCGAVEFEVDLENGFENIRRCNCSICSRKGAVMAGVPLEKLRVVVACIIGVDMATIGPIGSSNGAAQTLVSVAP